VELARTLQTEIISADSRQCYRELKIGVARPSEEELQLVPHHFIASHSIHEKLDAAVFENYALQKAAQIFQHHDYAVMVGGTGLYLRAFCEGMDAIPSIPEAIRNEISQAYAQQGLAWLQQQVQQLDPQFYREGEIQNPRRLMRALEVFKASGKSILSFRKGVAAERPFQIIKFALNIPREQLHRHINKRVEGMMEAGLLAEVESLVPYQHLNALQTVGYKELFDYLNGQCTLADAVADIKTNTRQYAKRQLTWFRKDTSYTWIPPETEHILSHI
jgi:tRNA dimethylallyltransferase